MDLVAPFSALFAGRDNAHGTYDLTHVEEVDGRKRKGSAVTKREPVTPELWDAHLRGEGAGLGIVPIRTDSTCVFGAIDIDEYVGLDHADLAKRLVRLKLPLIVCRSKSGGAHLYLFATEAVPAGLMVDRLSDIAALLSVGNVEKFPKQRKASDDPRDVGSWINMPYFGGVRGMRYAVEANGNAMEPEAFLALAEKLKQGPKFFKTAIRHEGPALLADGPPCLEVITIEGIPEGGRNNALLNVAVFLKAAYPDDWQNKLHAYNNEFVSPPLPAGEVNTIAGSVNKKSYRYTCDQPPIAPCCNRPLCRLRKFGVGAGEATFPHLESLAKLQTDPPVWFLSVNGSRVSFSTEQLTSPILFARRCFEFVGVHPIMPKAGDWGKMLNKLHETCEPIDVGDQGGLQNQFFDLLEQFCVDRGRGTDFKDLLLRKPATVEGRTYFVLLDLCRYLERQGYREMKQNEITAALTEIGGKAERKVVSGRKLRLWHIPPFELQNEPHDAPEGGTPDAF